MIRLLLLLFALFAGWSFVPAGGIDSTSAAAEYKLPGSPDEAIYLTQGNNARGHNTANGSLWAFDFAAAEAKSFTVVAARAGRVIGSRSNSSIQCLDTNHKADGTFLSGCWKEANFVLIDHGDDSAALYLHLQKDSVVVKEGQGVQQGQPMATADNTGWSTGTHLHFQVEKLPSQQAQRDKPKGWWWTQSVKISFSDKDVLAKNPDGIPTAGNSYKSDNGPSPHPIIGKWKPLTDGYLPLEFRIDGTLMTARGSDPVTATYKILDGDRLQIDSPGYASIEPFQITGDRLLLTFHILTGYETAEYQRVSGNQPSPQQVPPMAPVPNTPVATARLFIQALVSGDTSLALQFMPASTDATARAALPNISGALRACFASQTSASALADGSVIVQFTPPCGNYDTYYDALPSMYKSGLSASKSRNQPMARCIVVTERINDQWRVTYLPVCFLQ